MVEVDVVGSIAEARPTLSDTMVLAVKSQDAEAAIAAIAWVPLDDGRGVVADLPILTLQNGLATEDAALRRFDRVIGVSIGIPASHLEPGVVVSPGRARRRSRMDRRLPARRCRARRSATAWRFARARFAALIEPDIAAAKRRKLIANLRNVVDVFDATIEEQELAERLLAEEARRVFADARLPSRPRRGMRLASMGDVPGHEPGHLSTWQSFARGTSSEVDYLSGEIALIARRHGLEAPLNAAVARELGALAARGGRPGEVALPPEFASGSLTRRRARAMSRHPPPRCPRCSPTRCAPRRRRPTGRAGRVPPCRAASCGRATSARCSDVAR